MARKRQIKANRRSTGPRTAAGKAASSANALRHGLSSTRSGVLELEDPEAFENLQRGVIADLAPRGTLQAALAQRVAIILWRLDRVARIEVELFRHGELDAHRDKLRAGPRGRAGARQSWRRRTRPWTRLS